MEFKECVQDRHLADEGWIDEDDIAECHGPTCNWCGRYGTSKEDQKRLVEER